MLHATDTRTTTRLSCRILSYGGHIPGRRRRWTVLVLDCCSYQIQATCRPCSAVDGTGWSSGSPLRAIAIFRTNWSNGDTPVNNREIIFHSSFFLFYYFFLLAFLLYLPIAEKFLVFFPINLRAHETRYIFYPCKVAKVVVVWIL